MTLDLRICRWTELTPQPWKNGAGTTREIARDGTGDDWRWRISIADVVAAAPFSSFPGIDRILVLLEGEGIFLDFDDGRRMDVLPPWGMARFEGEAALRGTPVNGDTRDFNLMWRRDAVDAWFEVRPVVGTMVIWAEAGETWLVHVVAGDVVMADGQGTLARGDTAVIEAASRGSLRMEGAGTAFLIRLRPQ